VITNDARHPAASGPAAHHRAGRPTSACCGSGRRGRTVGGQVRGHQVLVEGEDVRVVAVDGGAHPVVLGLAEGRHSGEVLNDEGARDPQRVVDGGGVGERLVYLEAVTITVDEHDLAVECDRLAGQLGFGVGEILNVFEGGAAARA